MCLLCVCHILWCFLYGFVMDLLHLAMFKKKVLRPFAMLQCFAMFFLCFCMVCYVFGMFCYVFLMFSSVFLCFAMFRHDFAMFCSVSWFQIS